MRGLAGFAAGFMVAMAMAGVATAKDTLTLGMALEPPGLDPTAGAAAAIDEVVYANLFEGLTRIDSEGRVQPALAERWSVSEDGLTWTFTLRAGVTFHDGSSFDAEDVVFSLTRAKAPDSANAQKGLFEAIETVTAVDPLTVAVTLSRPEGAFAWNMGWGDAVMVAPESAATNATAPVGTGPFRFAARVEGQSVTLERNAEYWGEAPALASVEFRFITDTAAQVAALKAGDIDAFPNIGASESLADFANDPAFKVVVGTTEGETVLVPNQRRAPWNDVRVRQALQHAIDRKALVMAVSEGYGTPIGSHFAPHNPAYVDLSGRYPYDPDTARQLLAAAGVAPGTKAVMKLPPPAYARRGGEVIAAYLAAVGITVEIVPVEWGQWLSDVFRGAHDFDLTIVSHTEPLDIGIYARPDYYFGYSSDAFNALMDQVKSTAEPAGRNALYAQAQELLAADAANVFLYQLPKLGVWRAGLSGLWANAPIQANDVTAARWAE